MTYFHHFFQTIPGVLTYFLKLKKIVYRYDTPIETLYTQYDPRLGDSNEDRVAGAPVSLAGVASTKCIVKHIGACQYVS